MNRREFLRAMAAVGVGAVAVPLVASTPPSASEVVGAECPRGTISPVPSAVGQTVALNQDWVISTFGYQRPFDGCTLFYRGDLAVIREFDSGVDWCRVEFENWPDHVVRVPRKVITAGLGPDENALKARAAVLKRYHEGRQ
jgi:hypothetical protein